MTNMPRKLKMNRILSVLPVALLSFSVVPCAIAAPITEYNPPAPLDIMNNTACVAEGDFVSCSTALLNYYSGIDLTKVNPDGYGIKSDQGSMQDFVVVGTGSATGQSGINTDFSTQIDHAYDTPNNGNFTTSTASDPTNGPTIASVSGSPADSLVAWDTTLVALRNALTINGVRQDMLIGYDFNETGGLAGQGVEIWALVTVRDVDGVLDAGLNKTFSYELNGKAIKQGLYPPASSVFGFTSDYNFDGVNATTPTNSLDYTYVAGDVCVKTDGTFYTWIQAGVTSCALGETHVATNLGTSKTEWISYIPELDSNLEKFIAQGYDVLSVQFRIGCFNTDTTFTCNSGGYDDVFIMAGEVGNNVPEPGSLLLLGLAMAGLGFSRRRKI